MQAANENSCGCIDVSLEQPCKTSKFVASLDRVQVRQNASINKQEVDA